MIYGHLTEQCFSAQEKFHILFAYPIIQLVTEKQAVIRSTHIV